MKKHKFYFTDSAGNFNGYDRQTVWVDANQQLLHVGRSLTVPLREVVSVDVRPLPRKPKTPYLAIEVCGPTIENGTPTTVALIHKDFFANTKRRVMQEFVDEIGPLLNSEAAPASGGFRSVEMKASQHQSNYVLNVSLLIGFYRKVWYAFDFPSRAVKKTLFLMFFGGVVNVIGILLAAVPFDNYRMSKNLVRAGWSNRTAVFCYVFLTYPAYVFWLMQIVRWFLRDAD